MKQAKKKMELELKEVPKGCTIIEGFPGFGFVSTIVTNYLADHLDAKPIGDVFSSKLMALVAIHEGKVVNPIEILYDKKHNILIVQASTTVNGLEWDIADMIIELAKVTQAKEVLGIEGVMSTTTKNEPRLFYYTNAKQIEQKMSTTGMQRLEEGIIVGVTGALLLRAKTMPVSCIFVESHANIPDNKAAAEVIKKLNTYLGFDIDYKPLLEKAKKVEARLKQLLKGMLAAKMAKR
jgi:predicted ATP-grasp superfamily ATP-dependent carboligase